MKQIAKVVFSVCVASYELGESNCEKVTHKTSQMAKANGRDTEFTPLRQVVMMIR